MLVFTSMLLLIGNIPIIDFIIRLRIVQMLWKYKGISKPLGKEWGAWRRRQCLTLRTILSLTNPQNNEMKYCENMEWAS